MANEKMHKLAGFLNELANKVKTGTIHVWDGKQMVCYGYSDTKGWRRL